MKRKGESEKWDGKLTESTDAGEEDKKQGEHVEGEKGR